MSETIKKHVEKILKTSATVAIVGATAFSQVAKAEEVEEVVAIETTDAAGTTGEDTALTVPEAEAKKAVAQSEVKQVQEQKAQADQAVEAAQTKLDEDKKALAEATAAREKAEGDFIQAVEITKVLEENPEKPAEVEEEIKAKSEKVAEAKSDEAAARTEADKQAETVKQATTAKETAEKAVADADAKVKEFENSIQDPEKVEAEKIETDKSISTLETEITSLEKQVATATETVKAEAEAELKKRQSELTAKQAELEALEKEHGKTVTTQGASIDTTAIMGGNEFVISSYPVSTINKANTQGYNSLTATEKTNFLNATKQYVQSNQYKQIASDNYSIELDNLTEAQQNEIAIFAAELINDVREAIGLSPIEVVAGAQAFADSLTDAYKRKNGSTIPSYYHEPELLRQEAVNNGLSSSDTYNYEALGVGDIYESNGTIRAPRTMNELKMGIYGTLRYFLFNDDYSDMPLGHTVNLLRSGSGTVYLGVDTTSVGNSTMHYMVVDAARITDSSKFSTQSVSKGTTTGTVDKSAEIASVKTEITALNQAISTLNNTISNPASSATVTNLKSQVATKQSELAKLQAKSTELAGRLSTLATDNANLQAQLATAQSALSSAQTALQTATTTLQAEEAELAKLTNALEIATNNRVALEEEVASLGNLLALYNNPNLLEEADAALSATLDAEEQAKNQLTEDEKALVAAQTVQEEVESLLATKQVALEEAEALLAALIAEYEGLLVDRDEEGVHAVLDENLTEDELPVFEIPADGKAPEVETGTGAVAVAAAGTGAAGAAAVQKLTNKVLTAKQATTVATKAATASLPKTGDKSSLVAAVLGSMMMSSAALAAYKRREED